MGGSSGNDTTKQTTKSEPWGPQTPYLKYGMDEATRLYQSAGPQYYPGSTVAGFSPTQQQAQQLGTSRALNGSQAMNNAQGFSNSVLGGGFSGDAGARGFANSALSGGYGGNQNAGDFANSLAGGAYGGDAGARNFANASMSGAYGGDAGARGFANASMSGAFGGDAGARGYVNDVMSGKYLNSDPYSDNVYQNIQSKVMPSVNSQFMGSGRYGSNLQTDTATRALTESYAPYASQQYQSGLDRMGQAASMSDAMYNNAYGRMAQGANMSNSMYNDAYGRMAAGAGMADSMYNQNLSNRLQGSGMANLMYNDAFSRMSQGAGMAQDMYNTDVANRFGAAGMAPMFAANDWTDINALSNIGGQQQQLAQQELNDAAARWDYYQQLPYNKLGQYQNNIGGNYGGTTVGKTQTPQPSMFQQAAGAGVGLLGSYLSGGIY